MKAENTNQRTNVEEDAALREKQNDMTFAEITPALLEDKKSSHSYGLGGD